MARQGILQGDVWYIFIVYSPHLCCSFLPGWLSKTAPPSKNHKLINSIQRESMGFYFELLAWDQKTYPTGCWNWWQVCMLCNRPLPERIDRFGAWLFQFFFLNEKNFFLWKKSWKVMAVHLIKAWIIYSVKVNIHMCQILYMFRFGNTFFLRTSIWADLNRTEFHSVASLRWGLKKHLRPYEVFRTDCGKHSSATGPSQKT